MNKIKRNFYLTEEADKILIQIYTQSLKEGKKVTMSDIVDEALKKFETDGKQ